MNALTSRLILLLSLFLGGHMAHAQLTVTPNNNAAALVNTLIGSGVSVSNVSINCPQGASGTFNGAATNLGINNGVLLTSGGVAIAAQANLAGFSGQDNNGPGDPDLDVLSGVMTFDACILEFDFVATCDTISISYVFGSEEYDEFVCSGVNDAFGFFINGPGLNNVNVALVPGTTIPVSINTVNIGTTAFSGGGGPGCDTMNFAYYVSNVTNTSHEYDGQTVQLEAKTWVQPCSTYHVKLAIADGGDGVYDSGVFLEQSGIRCTSQEITVNTTTASGSNYLVEGCTQAVLNFERAGNLSIPQTVHFSIGGTSQNGVDYNFLADSVVFAAGIDSVGLLITAPDDAIAEGTETIFIIVSDTVCTGSYSDTAALFIIDPPNAAFGHQAVCPGQALQFSNLSSFAGVVSAYNWTFGDGGTSTQAAPSHTYVNPGTYSVQLLMQTVEGCRDSVTQTITVNPNPTANWSATQFCHQLPTSFQDLSSSGISTYAWNFGDGNTSNTPSPAHTYANIGTYNVSLQVTDGNGCTATQSQPITIHFKPVADYGYSMVCEGQPTSLIDMTGLPIGTTLVAWEWTLPGGITGNTPIFNHNFSAGTTFGIQLIVTTDQGCRDTTVEEVEVYYNPVPDFSLNFACIGDTTFFTDLSTIGGLYPISGWDWQFGDGGTSTDQNAFHIYTAPGNFAVTLTATSTNGCATTLVREIGRPPFPEAPRVFNDTICPGFGAILEARSLVAGGELRWYEAIDALVPFSNANYHSTQPLHYSTPWYVDVLSPEGCVSDRVPVYAIVSAPPNPSVSASTYETALPNAIVEFTGSDAGGATSTWLWDFGDGNVSTLANPVHQYGAEGSYDVVLNVETAFGCEATYTLGPILVTIDVRLFAPNAFTPNGDGLNDVFNVHTRLITDLSVRIYDRWGKLHFASNNIAFEWDGTDAGGDVMPEGVYTYVIEAVTLEGERIVRPGTVMLLR